MTTRKTARVLFLTSSTNHRHHPRLLIRLLAVKRLPNVALESDQEFNFFGTHAKFLVGLSTSPNHIRINTTSGDLEPHFE